MEEQKLKDCKIQTRTNGEEITISIPSGTFMHKILFVFIVLSPIYINSKISIIGDGMIHLKEKPLIFACLFSPLVLAGYWLLVMSVNRTKFVFSPKGLRVSTKPIPWPFVNRFVEWKEVENIYASEFNGYLILFAIRPDQKRVNFFGAHDPYKGWILLEYLQETASKFARLKKKPGEP